MPCRWSAQGREGMRFPEEATAADCNLPVDSLRVVEQRLAAVGAHWSSRSSYGNEDKPLHRLGLAGCSRGTASWNAPFAISNQSEQQDSGELYGNFAMPSRAQECRLSQDM